jgi:hypothetical protein
MICSADITVNGCSCWAGKRLLETRALAPNYHHSQRYGV